jgi:protein-S-isoprenylcysteine O-methyltransferase Ste14
LRDAPDIIAVASEEMRAMGTPEIADRPHASRLRVPRWTALITWPVLFLLAHAVAPSELARLTPRYGWVESRPGVWNLFGLVGVVSGFACLIWCLSLHFVRCPRMVEVKLFTPPSLLTDGPYRWSRNPMYVAALAIWTGWALFYGSVAVLVVMVAAGVGLAFAAVPTEERMLEAQFGEAYLRYKDTVPRWLGRTRR